MLFSSGSMHNLFLGTAKHVMHVWIKQSTLSKSDWADIEHITSKIRKTHHVGRIPLTIEYSFPYIILPISGATELLHFTGCI